MKNIFYTLGIITFFVIGFFLQETQAYELSSMSSPQNSQSLALLKPNFTVVIPRAIGGAIYTNYSNDVLIADSGILTGDTPFKQLEDTNGISLYIVRNGDTLSGIAELFDVSINTIKWENKLSKNTLKVGQELSILPVTGVRHTIKKGDTFVKIAKKYDVETEDITIFNNIDATKLKVGADIIIPNGAKQKVVYKSSSKNTKRTTVKHSTGGSATSGYYIRPAAGRVSSRFGPRHGRYHYGIDFANKPGTAIVAAASGTVIKSRAYCTDNSGRSSCGGGYGNHIIIQHKNGTKTLYAHARKVLVANGAKVKQGQKIAEMGNTGRSSGAHTHFEIIKSNGQKMNPNRLF